LTAEIDGMLAELAEPSGLASPAAGEEPSPVRRPGARPLASEDTVDLLDPDVTPERRMDQRRAFLATVSDQLLATSLDYEVRLAKVAQLAVPRLADWAAIDMVDPDGTLRRVTVEHSDPRKVQWVLDLERQYPPDPAAPSGVPGVVRSGKGEMVPEITDDMLEATARDAEHLRLIRGIGLHSYLAVPLIAGGRALGAITFATAESRRVYGLHDLAFAEEMASRASAAIASALLYAETDRARARAEAAEQRFRSLAEAIPQIVWTNHGDGTPEYLSPKWDEYTGQTPEESPHERWSKAFHPDDYPACVRRWAAALDAGTPWEVEYRLRRADGVFRWHLGRCVPQREGGRIVKWYGTATDIDEQKRSIRTRDDVLAMVSHDLRGPVSVIALSANLLREGEDATVMLGAIDRSVQQIETLIRDLLDIAAIEAGALSLRALPWLASTLTVEAIERHQAAARQRGVTVQRVKGDEDAVVHCDRDRVLQVFANLLGNALKFTPRGGVIRVSHGIARDEAWFSVSDTGPGIPVEHRGLIFDRFWRDRTSANAGTGLGLAICKGIIDQHGGHITVEGREGEGATFVFTLPLDQARSLP
jgi:PAS domain S-box-containing protein